MKKIIYLIPPSEGKTDGGDDEPLRKHPQGVEEIHKRFLNYDKSYEELIGVKGNYLQESIENNKNILLNPTMKALQRYSGTVYKHLDYESLTDKAKIFAGNHFVITSAMFGLIFGKKLIPNYKLKMNKLKAYKHWKKQGEEFLKNYFVIDVLTNTHRRSVNWENGLKIDFKKIKNGKLKSAGHAGKKIKGKFLHWIAKNDVTNPKKIKEFDADGYMWNKNYFVKNEIK